DHKAEARVGIVAFDMCRDFFHRFVQISAGLIIAGRCTNRKPSCAVICGTHDEDRKSTRLNSSHVKISYAVFCLKKKKTDKLKHTYNRENKRQGDITHIYKTINTTEYLQITIKQHNDSKILIHLDIINIMNNNIQ